MSIAALGAGLGYRTAQISTVSTAATSYALIDIKVLKADLNIVSSTDDGFLRNLIARASRLIAKYCNQPFVVEGITDTFFPARDLPLRIAIDGADALSLSRWPVLASPALSLTLNGDALTAGTDFILDANRGLLFRLDAMGYPTRWGPAEVVAVYSAGYAAIPDDVIDACEIIVKARYASRSRDPALKTETLTGVYQAQYFGDQASGQNVMSADVRAILDQYRVPVIG